MHTLLAIVEVPEERRVRCQAAGCGRGVYRRIHVVRDDEQLRVLGSDCYGHLYGAEAERTSVARWGTSARLLTAEERAMLVENTAALIARFEEEAHQQESQRKLAEERRVAAEQQASAQARRQAEIHQRTPSGPWNSRDGHSHRPKSVSGNRDALAQFRAQMLRQATQEAINRHPELGVYPSQKVADAMARAKAKCLEEGLNLTDEGSAEEIQRAAIALLQARR